MDLSFITGTWDWLILGEILGVDIVFSGDNAILIAIASAGLAPEQRKRAILFGIGLAVVLRIVLSLVTVQLLAIPGVLLAGGLLLLYIAWSFFKELRAEAQEAKLTGHPVDHPTKTMATAIRQIVIADLSMSLDNVLAVAGAAGGNMLMLVVGLAVSILLMGVGATVISKLLERYKWIAYAGVALLVWIAAKMIWEGAESLLGDGEPHAAIGEAGRWLTAMSGLGDISPAWPGTAAERVAVFAFGKETGTG